MKKTEVLQLVMSKLGANYKTEDKDILTTLLEDIIMNASFISNREIDIENDKDDKELKFLSPEIVDATIVAYLNRGVENVKSQSELGQSNTFVDYHEKLRNDIIRNGKRVMF